MAGQAGFEPATLGFGVRCSSQLELLTLRKAMLISYLSQPLDQIPAESLQRRYSHRPNAAFPATDEPALNLGLAMGGMRAARRTELLDHELFGLLLLVLAGRVITPFAAIACQAYQISHHSSLLFGHADYFSGPKQLNLSLCRDGTPRGRQIVQAHDGIRTRDLFLTKEVLYRLSYMGPDFIPRPRAATLSDRGTI
jgi:hypothetical protein